MALQFLYNSGSTGYNIVYNSCTYGNVVIPSSYAGPSGTFPVKSIKANAFFGCCEFDPYYDPIGLNSISIPDTITTIEANAFQDCLLLTGLSLGTGLTTIQHDAFLNCPLIGTLNLPESLRSIGDYAFYGAKFSGINIGSKVSNIGNLAFRPSLDFEQFAPNLTGIFVSPSNLNYSSDTNGVLFNKNKTLLIQYPGGNTNYSYTIPSSVTGISDNAFTSCAYLQTITVPAAIKSIGAEAFADCRSLSNISIPTGISNIRYRTFAGSSIQGINIPNFNITGIESGAFEGCTALGGYVTIPNSVINMGNNVFNGCQSLYSVIIGNNVNRIGNDVFVGCEILTDVTIGNSVSSIGDRAFAGCYYLNNFTIPNAVTGIGQQTFFECDTLTNISIPSGVVSIGSDAFHYCSNLTGFFVNSNNPSYSSDANGVLFNKNKTLLIQYPQANTNNNYTIPNGVISIAGISFYDSFYLYNITIPETTTSIGTQAFANCINLDNINIPNGVTSIPDGGFINCQNLKSITLLNSLTSIGNGALAGCANLNNVVIPKNLKSIGAAVFQNCIRLTNLYFLGNAPTVGISAFLNANANLKIFRYSTKFNWPNIIQGRNVLLIDSPIHQGLQTFGFANISPGEVSIKKQNTGGGKISSN